MAKLYESYVRGLFERAFGSEAVPAKNKLVFPLGGTAHQIELDGMLLDNRYRRVIECKYRIVEDRESLSFDEGELPNAHLFQTVAYAMHEDVRANEVILVYPALGLAHPVEEALTVSGFRTTSDDPLHIRVLLISLMHQASSVVQALRDTIPPRP